MRSIARWQLDGLHFPSLKPSPQPITIQLGLACCSGSVGLAVSARSRVSIAPIRDRFVIVWLGLSFRKITFLLPSGTLRIVVGTLAMRRCIALRSLGIKWHEAGPIKCVQVDVMCRQFVKSCGFSGAAGPRGSLVEALRELHVLRKSQYAPHRGIEKIAHLCDKVDWLSDWIGILP